MNATDPISHAANIVASYASNNKLSPEALTTLVKAIHNTLTSLGTAVQEAPTKPMPAVSIHKSVFREYIICLEDGQKMKTLKRHLNSAYGMTPEDYRRKWGLPASYPMVAPAYTERRRALAKDIGLGTIDNIKRIHPVATKAVVKGKVGRPRKIVEEVAA